MIKKYREIYKVLKDIYGIKISSIKGSNRS